jgi:predicted extracellular nuclease
VGTIEWHINIDEAPLLDYNLEHGRDPALFDASTPYRAADHDPIIIGLELTN